MLPEGTKIASEHVYRVKKKMFVLCVMWMPGACSQVWGTAKISWKIRRISKKSPKGDAGLEKHPWEG